MCGAQSTGAWNTTDWVPILVKSSIALGALPDLEGVSDYSMKHSTVLILRSMFQCVSWVPMDAVSGAFTDLVLADTDLPQLVNLTHPRRVSWRDIFKNVNAQLNPRLPFLPYSEWLSKLEQLSENAGSEDMEKVVSCLVYMPYDPTSD